MVLLRLARWLSQQAGVEVTTTFLRDGPLVSEFAKHGRVIPSGSVTSREGTLSQRAAGWWQAITGRPNDIRDFDVVYANTIVAGEFLSNIPRHTPIITHVHELAYWFGRVSSASLQHIEQRTCFFVAASVAVRDYLVNVRKIPANRVGVCYEFIDSNGVVRASEEECTRIRQSFGIPAEARVVTGSGCEFWRKGRDLIPILLACLCDWFPATHILWVGQSGTKEEEEQLDFDLERSRVKDRYHRVGEVADPIPYFSTGNAFALLSRDDPFPLVCLENIAIGNPVVCFEGSGGMPELVGQVPHWVVPYGHPHLMADRLNRIFADIGDTAAGVARLQEELGRRCVTDSAAAWIYAMIKNVVEQSRRT